MKATNLLFVYGTLKIGFENQTASYLQRTQKYVGKGYFPGKLFKINFYPGAVYLPEASTKVHGDVFQITNNPDELFHILDEYEGIGNHFSQPWEFERREIPVSINGQDQPAHIYLFSGDHSGFPVIESGVFSPAK